MNSIRAVSAAALTSFSRNDQLANQLPSVLFYAHVFILASTLINALLDIRMIRLLGHLYIRLLKVQLPFYLL